MVEHPFTLSIAKGAKRRERDRAPVSNYHRAAHRGKRERFHPTPNQFLALRIYSHRFHVGPYLLVGARITLLIYTAFSTYYFSTDVPRYLYEEDDHDAWGPQWDEDDFALTMAMAS